VTSASSACTLRCVERRSLRLVSSANQRSGRSRRRRRAASNAVQRGRGSSTPGTAPPRLPGRLLRVRSRYPPVRQRHRPASLDRKRVRVIRVVDEALHGVVAPPGQANQRLDAAIGRAEQGVDPPADVVERHRGGVSRLTPVGVILLVVHDDEVVHWLELGAAAQRPRAEHLLDVRLRRRTASCTRHAAPASTTWSRSASTAAIDGHQALDGAACPPSPAHPVRLAGASTPTRRMSTLNARALTSWPNAAWTGHDPCHVIWCWGHRSAKDGGIRRASLPRESRSSGRPRPGRSRRRPGRCRSAPLPTACRSVGRRGWACRRAVAGSP
jgi:hypothetical protein